jgi:GT2 family glycosyltransferase
MDSAPIVSVIVVNYNGLAFIGEAIDSLLQQTRLPDEIIVVDNASVDGSPAAIAAGYPAVRLVHSPSNRGFAGGVNLGIEHANGNVIALLNSDARAEPQWLELLVAELLGNPLAAVVEGKILRGAATPEIDQAGALFNNLGNYWGRGYREHDRGQFDERCEVAGVTACAMLVRREALRGEPVFDERFFMYGEELDLTLRLRINGWSIRYVPDAVVHHGGMSSIKASMSDPWLFQQFHANRNRLAVVARYYPAGLIRRNLPLLLLSLAYVNAMFLVRGGLRSFARAVFSQITFFARGLRERPANNSAAAEKWLPWMTRHSLRDLLKQKQQWPERQLWRAHQ